MVTAGVCPLGTITFANTRSTTSFIGALSVFVTQIVSRRPYELMSSGIDVTRS